MSDEAFEFPDDLKKAAVKLEFGHTIFALLERKCVEFVAGFRESFNVSPEEWYGMSMFGPELTADIRQAGEAKSLLETMLTQDLAKGYSDRLDAIVIGYDVAFRAFAEGLILDNRLNPIETSQSPALTTQLYLGRILLNGRVWKLLVQDEHDVLGSKFSAASIDRYFHILA